jgi:hypothetical protein
MTRVIPSERSEFKGSDSLKEDASAYPFSRNLTP